VAELVAAITAGAQDPYQKMLALQNWNALQTWTAAAGSR